MKVAEPGTLLRTVGEARDTAALQDCAGCLPGLLAGMGASGRPAGDIVTAISSIGERIAVRLLQMAEQQLGRPPVPYAFAVAGSLARSEQILGGDQDNVLVLSDEYREDRHGDYFEKLSERVCQQLAACGYTLCPGDIMASNPDWRLPLKDWQAHFRRWIDEPEPGALLRLSIFFDLRAIHGETELVDTLRQDFLARTQSSPLFQAHLAASALSFRPALGWFGRLRFEPDEQGQKRMNLKKHGITPVVDLVRTRALASGLEPIGTLQRLQALNDLADSDHNQIQTLTQAFKTISALRIAHQARRIRAGQRPDYQVIRDQLSDSDERALQTAFGHIASAQQALTRQFRAEDFQ